MTPHEKAVEAANIAGIEARDAALRQDVNDVLSAMYDATTAAITAYLASMEAQGWVMVPDTPPVIPRPADLPMKDWKGWDLCAQAHIIAWREERRAATLAAKEE